VFGGAHTPFGATHYRSKIYITRPKLCNGKHQNVYGHHPFFLKKRWIKPRINKEKKNEETPLEPKPKSELQILFFKNWAKTRPSFHFFVKPKLYPF
jgi:hypothetical protein